MIHVRAPSRLHFGLLNADGAPLETVPPLGRFGGVGLMIEDPGVEIKIEPAPTWSATGPLADRALAFLLQFASTLPASLVPYHVTVKTAGPEHAGLGIGTQLGLAIAKALMLASSGTSFRTPELGLRVGRGARSAIGIHGFDRGGFIFESGKWNEDEIGAFVAHRPVPDSWRIVIARPVGVVGIHGSGELAVFRRMPPTSGSRTEALLRLITAEMIPALETGDCRRFGDALHDYNRQAGEPFAPAQGGPYACPLTAEIISFLRSNRISGVGQSSWGPTVFAVVEDESHASAANRLLAQRFGGDVQTLITRASRGHEATRCSSSSNSPVSS